MFDIFKNKPKTLENHTKNSSSDGFSLIEMAVVLSIMGVIAGGALSIGNAKQEQNKMELTRNRLANIDEALERHVKSSGYLPCPAEPGAAIENVSFGVITDCSSPAAGGIVAAGASNEEIRIGVVPIRSLNLANSFAYDGWNNRFTYAVITELAKDSASYSSYTIPTITNNVIQIIDKNGNQIPDAVDDTIIAFALISHGKDGKGSYNKVGSQALACDAAQADGENCDGDINFTDMRNLDSKIAANYYDDAIHWQAIHMLKDAVLKTVP